jgi:hypothetical protein
MQLNNSMEIAVYCAGRDDAKAGRTLDAEAMADRLLEIFAQGYRDAKAWQVRRQVSTEQLASQVIEWAS